MDQYQETFRLYDKVANAYEQKFMDLDLYNDTYDAFSAAIGKDRARILEIGCGPGNITKYLLDHFPGYDILGIDMAPTMLELAVNNNPTAQFILMDSREINTLTEKFDGIMCGFIAPYLSKDDCRKLISDAGNLLEKEGILYISAIEGNYTRSGYEYASNGIDRLFVYYHEFGYLESFFTDSGFTVIDVTRKKYPKGENFDTHIILIAKKI